MAVTNLVMGTITESSVTNGIGVTNLDFTPTGGFMVLRSNYNNLSGNTAYTYFRIGVRESTYYRVHPESEYDAISIDTIGTLNPTIGSNYIRWMNNSGSNYVFAGGTYWYLVWREE